MEKKKCVHDRYRWSNTLNEGICIDCMAKLTEHPPSQSEPVAVRSEQKDVSQGIPKGLWVTSAELKKYKSEEREKAIQDCQKIIGKIKDGLQQLIDESPNALSPDGRFGQRAEDRNHGMVCGGKLALTMVKLIEEKELENLKIA